jgi:hypothetical protein
MLTKHLWVSAVALLLVIGGITPAALAEEEETIHTRSVQSSSAQRFEDLGTSSTAVDAWRLVCPSGTSYATADVNDHAADGVLFTVILAGSTKARASLRQAPDGHFSSPAKQTLGQGIYYVYIHKNKASSAKVAYDTIVACFNSAGSQLPPDFTLGQDQ